MPHDNKIKAVIYRIKKNPWNGVDKYYYKAVTVINAVNDQISIKSYENILFVHYTT